MKTLRNIMFSLICGASFIACEKEEIEAADTNEINNNKKQPVSIGEGGSMAQFTIVGDYLYTVDYKSLHVFHIVDAENPVELDVIDLGVGIETIYPQNDYLFIGCQDGVRIYDISNPRSPVEVSDFEHVTSCDPVVANDMFAVATLRGGTECGGNLNEFDLFDITDITNPEVIHTEALTNPYGVGFSSVDPTIIYVCDGVAGLKAYDISNTANINLVMELPDLEAIDVISDDNNLLVVLTSLGIYQYDCSNPTNLIERSFIPSL